MANMLENQLKTAIEEQLDQQLDRLNILDTDDNEAVREQQLREMMELNKKIQKWLKNGQGVYTEVADENQFFKLSQKSRNIVCHFYRDSAERCRILDMHLKILAGKHLKALFCKLNVEKSPFLTKRLRIKVMPTILLIKNSKTRDFVVGFKDLGNCDDFSTEMLEWRIAQSAVIDYKVCIIICI